jgi:hypothetical protein
MDGFRSTQKAGCIWTLSWLSVLQSQTWGSGIGALGDIDSRGPRNSSGTRLIVPTLMPNWMHTQVPYDATDAKYSRAMSGYLSGSKHTRSVSGKTISGVAERILEAKPPRRVVVSVSHPLAANERSRAAEHNPSRAPHFRQRRSETFWATSPMPRPAARRWSSSRARSARRNGSVRSSRPRKARAGTVSSLGGRGRHQL